MVDTYVSNESMVVLVFISAKGCFGNAEPLRIVQKYDKDGKRTISVIRRSDPVPEKSEIPHEIRMDRPLGVRLSLGFTAACNKQPAKDEKSICLVDGELFPRIRC
ncbi:hypothetical protein BWQ96_05884 [Gracilariopsis chorda]|uniref:Uncharacterized protein n=1 Tax=Gracilariopsis chorda TaxID=448386 RepID=A0A2V3IQL8_9FLOR|nr:hypothetical protein BWQ96_05884 [Gracilariopsis chorda]|eukprot:PXF44364.1 hypothetical protein BWQ96_05884 [Gracilariopsis chorda]